jgi:hypothetical protein
MLPLLDAPSPTPSCTPRPLENKHVPLLSLFATYSMAIVEDNTKYNLSFWDSIDHLLVGFYSLSKKHQHKKTIMHIPRAEIGANQQSVKICSLNKYIHVGTHYKYGASHWTDIFLSYHTITQYYATRALYFYLLFFKNYHVIPWRR